MKATLGHGPAPRCALLALALSLAACGLTSSDASGESLRVFAASSLTDALPALDPSARYQFAGSDELALQLREGAQADVFAGADPEFAQELHDEGVVEAPVAFATNRLVLIVPRDNPADISSIGDVDRPGVALVVGAEGVPIGNYTRLLLAELDASDVLDNVVSEEQDAKGVVGKVSLGEADAGFVYATDVAPARGDVTVFELPGSAQPDIVYTVAVVSAGHRERAAAFVDLLVGPRGRSALRDAGFGVP